MASPLLHTARDPSLPDLPHKRDTFAGLSDLTKRCQQIVWAALGQIKHLKHFHKWPRRIAAYGACYQLVHITAQVPP